MSTLLTCVASAAARAAAGIEGRHGVPGCLTAALPSNHIKAAADRFAARLGRRVVSGQTAAFVLSATSFLGWQSHIQTRSRARRMRYTCLYQSRLRIPGLIDCM